MVKLINQCCPNSCQHCDTITIYACKSGLQVVISVITITILLPSMTSFIEPWLPALLPAWKFLTWHSPLCQQVLLPVSRGPNIYIWNDCQVWLSRLLIQRGVLGYLFLIFLKSWVTCRISVTTTKHYTHCFNAASIRNTRTFLSI